MSAQSAPRGSPAAAETVTGMDLIKSWIDQGHRANKLCPGCGEDCSTIAIVRLGYRYASCECDAYEYPHLAEELWHLVCMIEKAAWLTEDVVIKDALWALEQYRKASTVEVARRLREWYEATHLDGSPDG